ncbi:MAG: class I SAM-dependent methyltransferase [Candidatus Omnitrophota bacterium]
MLVRRIIDGIKRAAFLLKRRIFSSTYKLLFEKRIKQKSACPICQSDGAFEYYNGKYVILKCVACKHAYVNTMNAIPRDDIKRMYSSFDYWKRNCFHQNIFNIDSENEFKDFVSSRVRKLQELQAYPDFETSQKKVKIIEIGCSEAALLKHFYDKGGEVIGCDINEEIIKRASAQYKFPLIAGDFLTYRFNDTYDLVVSFHTLEHITDIVSAVSRFCEILNSGGKVVVEVPFGPEEYNNLEHFHFFSLSSLKLLFSKFFSDIEIKENYYLTASKIKCGAYYLVGKK